MTELIRVPKEYNYVAAFLTLDCNYRCTYCINHPGDTTCAPRKRLSASEWVRYLNALDLPQDLPITFQGGEPTLHPEFYELVAGIRKDLHLDLLTNLSFDVERFAAEVPPDRFRRDAPYASIRVTYHPGQSDLEKLLAKIAFLQSRDYSIGLFSIRIPGTEKLIEKVRERASALGIDYRTKEYLGMWRGELLGSYHYEGAVFGKALKSCMCRTSELLMAPDGSVYRCHRDLYQAENPVGTISGENVYQPEYRFRPCDRFGECNPCDVKRKTNRFQEAGHASVEISL